MTPNGAVPSGTTVPPVTTAVRRLTMALEAAARALAVPDLDALLSSEAALRDALVTLSAPALVAPAERAVLRRQVEDARAALTRCRRLGQSLADFARISTQARGEEIGYEPVRASRPRFLDARV